MRNVKRNLESIGWLLVAAFSALIAALLFTYDDIDIIADRLALEISPLIRLVMAFAFILMGHVSIYWKFKEKNRSLRDKITELERKQPADIDMDLESVTFSERGWTGGMPMHPLTFRVSLSIRNKGDEPGKITSVEFTQFEMGTDLLGAPKRHAAWRRTSEARGYDTLEWPYVVEAGQWDLQVQCLIELDRVKLRPEELAERLDELDTYSFVLRYNFEGFIDTRGERELLVEGSFESFKASVLEHWKDSGEHNLVYTVYEKRLRKVSSIHLSDS